MPWSRPDLRRSLLATRAATVLAAVLAVAAMVGTVVAAGKGEWIDATLRLAAAALLVGWAVARERGRHSHRAG